MTINVRVARRFSNRVDQQRLKRVARRTLKAENAGPKSSVTIVVVDNRVMRDLNKRYQHVDRTTDVLSFPLPLGNYIGDVVISYEVASENARAAHWRIRDEIEVLVVHGILHLFGHDDRTSSLRTGMWRRMESILGKVAPRVDKGRSRR